MKKLLLTLLMAISSLPLLGQDDTFNFDLPDDFANIDTLPAPKKFKSLHMLGVKYSYDLCSVSSNPSIDEGYYLSPLNFSLLYTYYHPLWDQLSVFGLQAGVKYGHQGYVSPYVGFGQIDEYVQLPLISQFKIDFSPMRLLIDIGPYYAYKLRTDKEGGFDQYDIRHDYGIIGGAGIAFVFHPFEVQVEANYQYSLCSMYHTYKTSDVYWVLTYPRNIIFSAALFVHLW